MSLLDINDIDSQTNECLLKAAVEDFFNKKYPESNIMYDYHEIKSAKDDDIFTVKIESNVRNNHNNIYIHLTSIKALNYAIPLIYNTTITYKYLYGNYEYVDVGGGIKKRLTLKLLKHIYEFA